MNLSRRNFLGGMAATTAFAAAPGCATFCKSCRPGKIALQLYSLNKWIPAQAPVGKVALAKALKKIAEVGFEGGCVGVGDGHVAGLHGHEFLVGFEVVIGGEHLGADELFLQYCHEVEEVLGVVVADVIDFVGREW